MCNSNWMRHCQRNEANFDNFREYREERKARLSRVSQRAQSISSAPSAYPLRPLRYSLKTLAFNGALYNNQLLFLSKTPETPFCCLAHIAKKIQGNFC